MEGTSPEHSPPDDDAERSRRGFLQMGLGALAAAGASGSLAHDERSETPFLPEELWKERMRAPDDGKRYGWVVDTRRCFGCHGCEVACKAENDVPLGHFIRQTIYHDFEKPSGGIARVMVPMSCQHCEDAPCIKACPCGALHKGSGGSVQVDYEVCSGHAACKEVCPYGAIYIDPVANQAIKCHNCTHRVDEGMEPACVSTCPSEALYFGDLNDPSSKVSRVEALLQEEGVLRPLRPEKNTQPRMLFAVDEDRPMSVWEEKIPGEGHSYDPDAYSVFNWGDEGRDAPEKGDG